MAKKGSKFNDKDKSYNKDDRAGNQRRNSKGGKSKIVQNGREAGGRGTRPEVSLDSITTNHPQYYNKNTNDYNATMSGLTWFNLIGAKTRMEEALPQELTEGLAMKSHKFPTIMAIDVVPGIGACDKNALNPVNKCFTMIFNELAAKTANANIGFQMPDLAMYLTSMSSIQALIGYAKKVLSVTNFWRTKNLSYPMALTSAHGFKWSEISRGKSDYVVALNDLIRMFNSMKVPHYTEVFDRQYAMMHNIFVDEDDDFGQIYTFRPMGYYKYSDTQMKCEWKSLGFNDYSSAASFSQLLNEIETALRTWYSSDDYRNINGAILRAFSDSPVYTIDTITINDDITPVQDEYFLSMIMNMDIVPFESLTNLSILQSDVVNGGIIEWQPRTGSSFVPTNKPHFCRLYKSSPSLDDNCELTRLMNVWEYEESTQMKKLISGGTEIVVGVRLYQVDDTASIADALAIINSNYDLVNFTMADIPTLAIQAFRYAPFMPICTEDNGYVETFGCIGDIYNYTTVSPRNLVKMHTVAMYSIWKPDIKINVY